VGLNLPQTDPIHKVSIIPRGMALGVTQTLPNEDMLNLTKEKAENWISFLMGGRCAEEIIFQEFTNGASNDIERATDLARNMVCTWGMSKLGPINFAQRGNANIYGGSDAAQMSDETAKRIDTEIANLIQVNYEKAKSILQENADALHRIAEGLMVWETLDSTQIGKLIRGEDIGVPIITPKKKEEPVASVNLMGSKVAPA